MHEEVEKHYYYGKIEKINQKSTPFQNGRRF